MARSYVASTCDCFWCVLTFWFIPLVNFDSLITSRNFPASPRILETVWCPQIDHPENHCSPQKTIFLKFRYDLVASKFNHKICMKVTKFISSEFRVDRWRFKKIVIVSNYVTLLESCDGFKKCITCSGAPCIHFKHFLKLFQIKFLIKFQQKSIPIFNPKNTIISEPPYHPKSIKNWQSNNDEFLFLVKLACNFYSWEQHKLENRQTSELINGGACHVWSVGMIK